MLCAFNTCQGIKMIEAGATAARDSVEHKCVELALALGDQGWARDTGFLSSTRIAALHAEAMDRWHEGEFRRAGIGRGQSFALRPDIRSDFVCWQDEQPGPELARLLSGEYETLRKTLNATLFTGLLDFEGHFTVYPPGAFYRAHVDQFQAARHRRISAILYLSPRWAEHDGGQLRLYPHGAQGRYVDILPEAGTLVCLDSESMLHEVLPTLRERVSLTGWFRTRE